MRRADQSVPLSALQQQLFCPRQCALIHNEQLWAENRFTAEGQVLHKKANEGPNEHRSTGIILRHLHVASEKHGIYGICDVVERHRDGRVIPVEYKRGKPKRHRADEVQLCAQALCLEEMLQVSIATGLIFYGRTRHRTEVLLDGQLRDLTLSVIEDTRHLVSSGLTPAATYDKLRCSNCSLLELCLPSSNSRKKHVAAWLERIVLST